MSAQLFWQSLHVRAEACTQVLPSFPSDRKQLSLKYDKGEDGNGGVGGYERGGGLGSGGGGPVGLAGLEGGGGAGDGGVGGGGFGGVLDSGGGGPVAAGTVLLHWLLLL